MPVIHDIAYLGEDRKETLDAYLPTDSDKGPRPAIVLIHGGGWHTGDKANEREVNIGTTLSAHGYAVFSINYLLNERTITTNGQVNITHVAWPQNFYDCKSALRFLRANALTYGIDTRRIAVMGSSAGGHLAMMVGATARNDEINQQGLYTEQANDVTCILNLYGDYDIRGRKSPPFPGRTPAETSENEEKASPINYIDCHTPPIFISHGTGDQTVSVERSRLLARHLQSLDLDYCYIEISKAPHSYDLQPEQMDIRSSVLNFLAKYL